MLQYWSTWNFLWFLGAKMNIFKVNYALKSSLILTSILGGSLVYIYPRKMVLFPQQIYRYKLTTMQMIITDLFFHQMPLLTTIFCENNDDTCGRYAFIPFSLWMQYNMIVKNNMDKLYGVPIKYLLTSSFSLYFIGSFIKHKLLK